MGLSVVWKEALREALMRDMDRDMDALVADKHSRLWSGGPPAFRMDRTCE